MRRSLAAAVLLVTLTVLSASALAQAPALTGEMEARKIVRNEENREISVPANMVYPSDTIEYTLTYWNSGDESASGVRLVGPVPEGTSYLEQTATDTREFHPLFSIDDGKSYHEAPVTYTVVGEDGSIEERIATPDMVTHIQWVMNGKLEVGREASVSYRVQVD